MALLREVAYDPVVDAGGGNPGRFSGFADIYDANRPSPPDELGPLLASYANVAAPVVVDIGSGTGLSSRWAATWAGSVVGVEPSDDMRTMAESRPTKGVTYRRGFSDSTGLPGGSADVVLAVQAMHWMEPGPTLAEVARVLRPGGVFAVLDADWPPVAGVARAAIRHSNVPGCPMTRSAKRSSATRWTWPSGRQHPSRASRSPGGHGSA